MNLQDRHLQFVDPPLNGADVRLLHEELRLLRFVIPDGELQGGYFGRETGVAVQKFQERYHDELRANGWRGEPGTVEEVTARFINREVERVSRSGSGETRYVFGRVVDEHGRGVGGIVARAFDQDLPSKPKPQQPLGEAATTDKDGRYRIAYTTDSYAAGEWKAYRRLREGVREAGSPDAGADVVIALFDTDGRPIMQGSDPHSKPVQSRLHVNAGVKQEIEDLIVIQGDSSTVSEYEQLLADLGPVIKPTAVAELTPGDVDFLAQETRWSAGFLTFAVRAAQFEGQTHLQSDAFYALLRAGLGAELADLLDQPRSVHAAAIESAFDPKQPIVALSLRTRQEEWLAELQRLRREKLPEPNEPSSDGLIGGWIASTLPFEGDEGKRKWKALIQRIATHDGDARSFWNALRADELLRGEVGKLQLNCQLGLLTQHDVALTRAVLEKHRPQALRDLVRLSEAEWHSLLKESEAAGSTDEAQRRVYAAHLVATLQLALPVEASAHAMAGIDATHFGDSSTRDGVVRFLWNVSADDLKAQDVVFDLATSHIAQFVDKHRETAYAGISEDIRPKVLESVKRVQRLYRISTRPGTLAALLEMPHGSAYEIARFSKKSFVTQYMDRLGGEEEAALIHDRAVAESATRLALATQMYQHLHDTVPAFMR